jgi:hypothetical protein
MCEGMEQRSADIAKAEHRFVKEWQREVLLGKSEAWQSKGMEQRREDLRWNGRAMKQHATDMQ